MLNEFNSLADAILELKKQGQVDDFIKISWNNYPSKAKMMIALAGLDDAALSAIDELEKLNGREEIQK